MNSIGTWNGPFGYAGGFGFQEDASRLKQLGHRYYDSSSERFLTWDPIEDGRNWFVYCDNSPINRSDPTGLKIVVAGGTPQEQALILQTMLLIMLGNTELAKILRAMRDSNDVYEFHVQEHPFGTSIDPDPSDKKREDCPGTVMVIDISVWQLGQVMVSEDGGTFYFSKIRIMVHELIHAGGETSEEKTVEKESEIMNNMGFPNKRKPWNAGGDVLKPGKRPSCLGPFSEAKAGAMRGIF